MSPAQPTKSEMRRAFVWPTVVALVIAAVVIVERLQVDWTVACSLHDENPSSCGEENFNMVFAWAPAAFTFGLAHIVGAASLYGGASSPAAIWERLARMAAYFAIHVFPVLGWYFFYVGMAAGFLVSITVIGIADSGGAKMAMYCLPVSAGQTSCTLELAHPLKSKTIEQSRTLATEIDDEFELRDGIVDAVLSFRWDNRTRGENNTDETTWKRLFCRLHVLNVTKAAFSVHQIIRCDADWPAEAIRVRAHVEGLFSASGTNSRSTGGKN